MTNMKNTMLKKEINDIIIRHQIKHSLRTVREKGKSFVSQLRVTAVIIKLWSFKHSPVYKVTPENEHGLYIVDVMQPWLGGADVWRYSGFLMVVRRAQTGGTHSCKGEQKIILRS
jgi:hypothetical protein